MKSLLQHIQENMQFRINRNTANTNKLKETFKETIDDNYEKNKKYVPTSYKSGEMIYGIDNFVDGLEIRSKVMEEIEDIIELFNLFGNEKDEVKEYYLNEWLTNYNYKENSLYSIVRDQCEYIFGEDNPENGLLYCTNYFEDYCIIGSIIRDQEMIWIREK